MVDNVRIIYGPGTRFTKYYVIRYIRKIVRTLSSKLVKYSGLNIYSFDSGLSNGFQSVYGSNNSALSLRLHVRKRGYLS